MLVGDIARRNAEFFGEADAVIEPLAGRRSSWVQMDARANQLARALRSLGIGKGERLAIFASNCAEFLDLFFGCARSGVIGAAVNVRLSAEDIASYLHHVEPVAVAVHASLAPQAEHWLADVPSIRHVIGVGADHGRTLDLEELLAAESSAPPAVDLADSDCYQLAATSGTTGSAKAAILTHRNALAAMANWSAELPIRERDTYLQCIPMFFNPGGPAGLHPVLLKGGRSVIYPGFDPRVFLQALKEFEVTHSVLVPTMLRMVLDVLGADELEHRSLRAVVIGGSPIPRAMLAEARSRFGDVFFPFFGMAESYSTGMVLRREEQFTEGSEAQLRHLFSAGKPMPFVDLRVVGEGGLDVPRDNNTPGEIWMRGANISSGYFRMPDETALVREGEWLKTGDIAVIDEEGFVTIVDRSKDIIITGGINVYSREVEEALHAHPAVAAAAVIGVPHERWGEAIHAVVVLRPDAGASEQELLQFASDRLAAFKKPRSLELVDELPLTATGKVRKRDLRARYWTATTADGR
jgi:acyl-CoA synthetase (AMP-forming)/AMP-acid ligase II